MKIVNILLYLFLLILNSCNSNDNDAFKKDNKSAERQQVKSRKKGNLGQKEQQQEKITLTSEESKMFNSLVNTFKYTIQKLSDQIHGCINGNKNKCNGFFDWLSKDIQKQKELANAFTKVYNFLESKRQSKASNENFDTYIKGAIDCKTNNQQDCNKDNKYGSGNDNEIEQYFRGMAGSVFDNKNDNNEIYKSLKNELLNDTTSHYDGLTANWKN
ncbi:Mlp family lipoprotein (plasmid) [Borreliella andersonii]|uniref:Mlp family lipoprotein n=1 Tax=Borrelia andersonii TaxID=42109 RepID=A0ACD5G6U1_BORAD